MHDIARLVVAVLGPGRLGETHLAALAAGRPTPGLPMWADAVTNQQLIQAAYRSVAERREVAPREISLALETDRPVGAR